MTLHESLRLIVCARLRVFIVSGMSEKQVRRRTDADPH